LPWGACSTHSPITLSIIVSLVFGYVHSAQPLRREFCVRVPRAEDEVADAVADDGGFQLFVGEGAEQVERRLRVRWR
jgi:hypothetical protein